MTRTSSGPPESHTNGRIRARRAWRPGLPLRRFVHDVVFRQSSPFPAGPRRGVRRRAAGQPCPAGAGRAQGPSRQFRRLGHGLLRHPQLLAATRPSSWWPSPTPTSRAPSRSRSCSRTCASTRTGANCSQKEADNLDSVNVSTPDHMHAPIAMAAMSLGKHVYVQKPLATTVRETRLLAQRRRASSASSRRWASRSRRTRRSWPPSR